MSVEASVWAEGSEEEGKAERGAACDSSEEVGDACMSVMGQRLAEELLLIAGLNVTVKNSKSGNFASARIEVLQHCAVALLSFVCFLMH